MIHKGAVTVENGVIRAVDNAGESDALPRECTQIELGDVTLLPGLIDTHVHLGFDGGPDPVTLMRRSTDAQQVLLMLRNAEHMLQAGVTTVRDLGTRDFLGSEVKNRIESGAATGPRLLTAGPPITSVGGHCWFMGGECSDVQSMTDAVRLRHKRGVDVIKIMVTGGFVTRTTAPAAAQFSRTELSAVVETAHDLGLRVAGHAHGTEGITMAVEAGTDTIEHCTWVGYQGLEFDPQVAELMAGNGTYVCPTVNRNARNPAGRIDWRQRSQHLAAMHAAGVPLLAGTDAGIENIPHHAYASGLEIMTDIGMSLRDILVAATVRAAAALGISHLTGSISSGLAADLLGVRGDPLVDLAALQRPVFVMAGGRTVPLP
ncbi:amidohydrolase family protein [Streptomyces hokutonensis]|uniref:Amidohydrolase family protein n=1 Tax=Streptomyces hokutonensis TaxID=1306990 RepID=A0ABW6ML44_9ACTN